MWGGALVGWAEMEEWGVHIRDVLNMDLLDGGGMQESGCWSLAWLFMEVRALSLYGKRLLNEISWKVCPGFLVLRSTCEVRDIEHWLADLHESTERTCYLDIH